ncbi:MAG: glycoside hydrolase family 172 protein [Mariniphaga sp.]
MKFRTIFLPLAVLLLNSCISQPTVSIETLLHEMADRESLTRFPEPSFSLKQFSSYDRATTKPGDPSWFANADRTMFIRKEMNNGRTEQVMFDANGPGVIVRFWMTFAGENSGRGTLRIYFDNQENPTIQGTAFDVLSGKLLAGKPLASSVSDSTKYEMRGHNLYLPIPYSAHCKITYESDNIKDAGAKTGGEAVYYNIDYRTYASNVKVTSFSFDELAKASQTLESVQRLLETRDRGLDKIATETSVVSGTIPAGGSISRLFEGSKAIRKIELQLNPLANPQSLRTTVMEIVFDGERTVWCPLGDFFGTGYQLRFSNTWYSSVNPDGTICVYWVMPFRKNAEVIIHNFGAEDVGIIKGEILTAAYRWDQNSMHFGTSWHQFTHLKTGKKNESTGSLEPFDVNYVELTGKGTYVGDAITLFNTVYAWWGEGDEKIYVNGETFPSHIGTGSEDYYGYAWCRPEKFANHPFIAQPDGSGNFWPGYTVNIRYRGLDNIPFTSSLKFDIEMWHWVREATINFAPVTFWYAMPGGQSNIAPDTEGVKAQVVLKRSDIYSLQITNGKIEGENMVLSSVSAGNFSYQNSSNYGWSNHFQAFWTNGKKGDQLRLTFISTERTENSVMAGFTVAPDYGEFRINFNGKWLPGVFNLYDKKVRCKEMDLGKQLLIKGENQILIEIVSAGPTEGKAFFGLDYLTFNNKLK